MKFVAGSAQCFSLCHIIEGHAVRTMNYKYRLRVV